jgi:hypothetical protein
MTSTQGKGKRLAGYGVHRLGDLIHEESWIPAEDLEEFNANIVDDIEFVAQYTGGAGAASGG